MKVWIVYDSRFGNTEKLAQAMGRALANRAEVQVARAGAVQPGQLSGAGFLVAGSPTHGGRPSSDMAKWLQALPQDALRGMRVAAFDTHNSIDDTASPLIKGIIRFFGFAAPKMAKELTKRGGTQALEPEGFLVLGREGPLKDGEEERAAAWVSKLLPNA